MSIIQDALRKAQRDKTTQANPPSVVEKKKGSFLLLGKIMIGGACVVGVVASFIGVMNVYYGIREEGDMVLETAPAALQNVSPGENIVKRQETAPASSGGLNLEGILYDEDGSLAIVNRTLIQEGDTIEGHRVIQIGRKQVTFEKENKRFEISLNT